MDPRQEVSKAKRRHIEEKTHILSWNNEVQLGWRNASIEGLLKKAMGLSKTKWKSLLHFLTVRYTRKKVHQDPRKNLCYSSKCLSIKKKWNNEITGPGALFELQAISFWHGPVVVLVTSFWHEPVVVLVTSLWYGPPPCGTEPPPCGTGHLLVVRATSLWYGSPPCSTGHLLVE